MDTKNKVLMGAGAFVVLCIVVFGGLYLTRNFGKSCLVDQPYAKDPKTTVGKVVKAAGGTITGFLRFRVGA